MILLILLIVYCVLPVFMCIIVLFVEGCVALGSCKTEERRRGWGVGAVGFRKHRRERCGSGDDASAAYPCGDFF